MKIARVVPVYKSGSRTDAKNYRPISLLCSVSKIFESVLHSLIACSVKSAIISNQHGFIAGRSTTTNLVSFMAHASVAVESRSQLDTVYCDLSKAFDMVSHHMLISKLSVSGISASLLALLKDYLTGRQSYVSSNGQPSGMYAATSGVPQGSVLGPLLFSIFVNDVSAAIKSSFFLLYADDIKIFKEISSISDCVLLQNDISAFADWCSLNSLVLNSAKTKIVSFTRKTEDIHFSYRIHGDLLNREHQLCDLGVLFDSKLSFTAQTDRITRRALRTLEQQAAFQKNLKIRTHSLSFISRFVAQS